MGILTDFCAPFSNPNPLDSAYRSMNRMKRSHSNCERIMYLASINCRKVEGTQGVEGHEVWKGMKEVWKGMKSR